MKAAFEGGFLQVRRTRVLDFVKGCPGIDDGAVAVELELAVIQRRHRVQQMERPHIPLQVENA